MPLRPWLMACGALFYFASLLLLMSDGYKTLRFVVQSIFYTCLIASGWIAKRETFEKLSGPNAKWYVPWSSAKFSIPAHTRIFVQDVDFVARWYVNKLGLRKIIENHPLESGIAKLKFKEDGRAIILTSKIPFGTEKTPMLLTKRIEKMKKVLEARGIETGLVEQDRQGIHYFEIHDPEGNIVEVVEER